MISCGFYSHFVGHIHWQTPVQSGRLGGTHNDASRVAPEMNAHRNSSVPVRVSSRNSTIWPYFRCADVELRESRGICFSCSVVVAVENVLTDSGETRSPVFFSGLANVSVINSEEVST